MGGGDDSHDGHVHNTTPLLPAVATPAAVTSAALLLVALSLHSILAGRAGPLVPSYCTRYLSALASISSISSASSCTRTSALFKSCSEPGTQPNCSTDSGLCTRRFLAILGDFVQIWAILAWVRSQNTPSFQVPGLVLSIVYRVHSYTLAASSFSSPVSPCTSHSALLAGISLGIQSSRSNVIAISVAIMVGRCRLYSSN
jgi:hypothetical protein